MCVSISVGNIYIYKQSSDFIKHGGTYGSTRWKPWCVSIKRWVANSRKSIIPVSQDDTLFAKEIRYFTLHVHEILGVQIPAGILKARDSVNDRLGVRFNLSLYNAKVANIFR